ncbi:YciI family protein [Pseudonocardia sp. CA-107938]|uniref:YciI family protein n=1 Tax=Pseudonocardia sp. CA-107938 TaxID=3240021 RepID=UPI003D8A3373
MYAVVLTYTAPLTEIDDHVPGHRAWLREQYDAGRLLVSGARTPRTGGFLLFAAMPRPELDAALAEDPFAVNGLADAEIVEFRATSTVDALAQWREPA